MDVKNFDQDVYAITGNGCFTEPSSGPAYRLKDMLEYCRRKGIDPEFLPDEERKQFQVGN